MNARATPGTETLLAAAGLLETFVQAKLDDCQAHGTDNASDYSEAVGNDLARLIEALQMVKALIQYDGRQACPA